ncbi:hypothetical protein EROM_080340 [Encephalitozoon romaleae SJ-2008]|uniref:Uncharacterized protein n=1 Tax=Encephalitozoon romaleae (strain SJ-2008) TaxID=1178016 RepID=I6ZUR5_ENCRO|nr:hypothetical protein EROM_080340 [Encephalitozoon romaleae SJ-2008]AFN83456.1 hypothetical protein EROM_080340 [Encephalitozoon romaleae SJ-2008]
MFKHDFHDPYNMEEYFQISDKTRTLEHQYTDLLTRKLRLETLLVEEDYNNLLVMHSELVSKARDSEDSYKKHINDLKTMIDKLNQDNAKKEDDIRRLTEENKNLMSTVQELEKKSKEESRQGERKIKGGKKGAGDLEEDEIWEVEGLKKMDEIHRIAKSLEGELQSNLSKLQEECIRYRGDTERMASEIEKLKLRNADNIEKINEIKENKADIEEKLKRLEEENARLAKEKICSDELRRSINEKDEIISALKENMKQKSELIEIQRRMIGGGPQESRVILNDDVCNVFDEEILKAEEGNDELELGDECNAMEEFWNDVPIKSKATMRKKPEGVASARRKTNAPKAEKIRRILPKAVTSIEKTKSDINTKVFDRVLDNKEISKTSETSRKLLTPGHLLKPENSSYFADLTFNNSSPVIKKDQLPKKR